MEDNIFDKVHEVDLKKTMETSYIDYAMSVIAARALPDVRDGLKPVQRRILYSMIELNNGPDKPHRKCARIVGDTMGKYHPHGDSSIYGALVNLAQEWSTRYPLVDGHGNFGSVDGDGAAAMRYTEARLSKISMEMTADINKDTVDFTPNFDETEKEPSVLPSRFPNLLVNGTSGIAVGMATNIPPHNLREVIAAVVKIIDDQIEDKEETTIEEILQIIKGPDFPTGAEILGTRGIEEAYRTGRGKIRVRAITNIEPMQNGKNRIIVTELPFMVNKARLIENIAELVKEKRIEGISNVEDHSDRNGNRIRCWLRCLLLIRFFVRRFLCVSYIYIQRKGNRRYERNAEFYKRKYSHLPRPVCAAGAGGVIFADDVRCGGYAGGGQNRGKDWIGRHQQRLHAVLYHQFPLHWPDYGRERSGGPVQGRKRPNGSAGHDRNAVLSIAGGFRCCYHPRPRHL